MSRHSGDMQYRVKSDGSVDVSPREGLLRRNPATKSRVAALDDVHRQLAAATVLFEMHGDSGRTGAYRALVDVVNYFAELGVPRASLLPLSAIAAALVDADRGVQSPIFKPDRVKGGRPPKAVFEDLLDQQLAVVMECCVRHHRDVVRARPFLPPAAREAAKIVNSSPLSCSVTPVQMREIRERVVQLPVGHSGRLQFDELLDSAVARSAPLEWAKLLVQNDGTQTRHISR